MNGNRRSKEKRIKRKQRTENTEVNEEIANDQTLNNDNDNRNDENCENSEKNSDDGCSKEDDEDEDEERNFDEESCEKSEPEENESIVCRSLTNVNAKKKSCVKFVSSNEVESASLNVNEVKKKPKIDKQTKAVLSKKQVAERVAVKKPWAKPSRVMKC